GARVLAADLREDRLQDLLETATKEGLNMITCKADMSIQEDVERVIQTAMDQWQTLDILVNNAGIMDNFAPVGELDDATWNHVMKVNTEAPFRAMRNAVKIFLAKGKGVIVNVASVGGFQAGRAGAAYTASKHALIGLSRNTGYMYAKSGIRCNVIAPGAVNTNIAETIDFTAMTPLINERIMTGLALNPRSGEADEIARVALFLASDAASFVNAAVLTVDGGWSAY
ncbi:MAG: SDR family oxidoreductase, partial [Bacteroidetes bacterium]|nr:SDR family oxidoreductase [Bacteroidota bacterium]